MLLLAGALNALQERVVVRGDRREHLVDVVGDRYLKDGRAIVGARALGLHVGRQRAAAERALLHDVGYPPLIDAAVRGEPGGDVGHAAFDPPLGHPLFGRKTQPAEPLQVVLALHEPAQLRRRHA